MKEHPKAKELRQAADNVVALFKSDVVDKPVTIACVLNNTHLDWELYVPTRPDKELYISPL